MTGWFVQTELSEQRKINSDLKLLQEANPPKHPPLRAPRSLGTISLNLAKQMVPALTKHWTLHCGNRLISGLHQPATDSSFLSPRRVISISTAKHRGSHSHQKTARLLIGFNLPQQDKVIKNQFVMSTQIIHSSSFLWKHH